MSSEVRLKPAYNRRVPDCEATPFELYEAVDETVSQAVCILGLLANQFTGQAIQMNDEINYYVIQSAINAVKDIGAVVEAYCEAQPKKSNNQN